MRFGACSESGKLRKVLMHRPGREILNVTPENLSHYGFREVPDLEKMHAEFNLFAQALRDEGVQVILLQDSLNDRLEDTSLPNLVFTRDILSVADIGLIVMSMAIPGRTGEPLLAKHALEHQIPVAIEIKPPGYVEGGDFVYVDEETLAVGYGPRTNLEGIIQLTGGLKTSQIEEIVSVQLTSSLIHLDQVFSVVAPEFCIVHERSLNQKETRIMSRGHVRKESFLNFLKRKKFDQVTVTAEEVRNFGANVCAVESRKVVLYEWNTRIIDELKRHGIDVIPIAGTELVKGGGGPHCMTCPILRD